MGKKSFPLNLDYLVCVLLITATLAVFWRVNSHDFVNLDDPPYITENPHVQEGLSRKSVVWAFNSTEVGLWMPLTWLSFMLDFELYELHAGGYHLTNLLFHLASTLLLFVILKQTTGGRWQSAFVAALFALHPLHVESVAWVTERKDVLSTFFWMITMWAYFHYALRPGIVPYMLAFFAFALGLMAKPMLVSLPFVLLLFDYWPLGRIRLGQPLHAGATTKRATNLNSKAHSHTFGLIWEKIPFFALAAICSAITLLAEQSDNAVKSLKALPISIRLGNSLIAYVSYIGKMIYPKNLAPFYPYVVSNLSLLAAAGAGLLLLLTTIFVLRAGRAYPFMPVGWFWYLGTLLPVIGLVQVGGQAMADRFTYVPLIGLFIMIAWGGPVLMTKLPIRRVVLPIAASAIVVIIMICSSLQVRYWKNSISLFRHALNVTSNNLVAFDRLGSAFAAQGEFDKAIENYNQALSIHPSYGLAHYGLSVALARIGKLQEALDHYSTALQINPRFSEPRSLRKLEDALTSQAQTLKNDDRYAKAFNGLGVALVRADKTKIAIDKFSLALQLKPDYAEVHNNLANALVAQGDIDEAIVHYYQALRLKPASESVHSNIAAALLASGRVEPAIVHYRKAMELGLNSLEAHNNLGDALLRQGNLDEAILHFSKALEIRGDYPEAHNNLGVALARQGKLDEAIIHFREAVRLKPSYAQARSNLELALQEAGKSN
jgi:tetratricopeptide (TPR) repeat protein